MSWPATLHLSADRLDRRASPAPLLPVVGADTQVPLVDGRTVAYANLDCAASAPALAGRRRPRRPGAAAVRQRAPRRRLPLAGVDRALRGLAPDHRRRSSAPGPTTSRSSPATPPTRSTCSPAASRPTPTAPGRVLVLDVEHHANLLPWQRVGGPARPCCTVRRPSPRPSRRSGAELAARALRAARAHRGVERHRRAAAGRRGRRDRPRGRRAGRRRRRPAGAAPPLLARRDHGRRLRRLLRATRPTPRSGRRAGRPPRLARRRARPYLAGGGAVPPGRRRPDAVDERARPGTRPARPTSSARWRWPRPARRSPALPAGALEAHEACAARAAGERARGDRRRPGACGSGPTPPTRSAW